MGVPAVSMKSISRTLQSSAGADLLQVAETRKIRNANVQINGKLVS
jgi:hypothetical protein